MLVGRKYRLTFTPEQAAAAEEYASVCRAVWNVGLEQRREYRRRGAWIGYAQQAREMAEAKADHPWLRVAPSHILQQTLRDLDKACRTHGTFGVRWKAKSRWEPSFRFPDPRHLSVVRTGRKRARVHLPKLGWVIFRWSRPLGGPVKSATVSREGKHWYISFLVETGAKETTVSLKRGRVGVDRGVATLAATSDGRFFDRAFLTVGEAERYRRLQQRHARTRKGSKRRQACRTKMRAIMGRVRHRRQDFHAQTACQVVDGNALVVLEDLNVASMTARAKGTIAHPGTRVRQKAGLNRAILDKGWHSFELAVRNRARHTGAEVRTVHPANTSVTCPVCGYVHPDNRKSQAKFVCTACGHREHADTVGAKNTLARGHAGHRAWRPRRRPVREAPTSANPQGISTAAVRSRSLRPRSAGGSPSPSIET
ncbi:RNA-guided endonuclease InsQ/TnpB family protein [Streptomyces sp. NPDC001410]|uniref:RNA-guided endonuclease InsQ/TnpB family protein n=1 Tax=Streptomyces sp. NPDC001410 TaxID=3364574 RepID=UPI003685B92F